MTRPTLKQAEALLAKAEKLQRRGAAIFADAVFARAQAVAGRVGEFEAVPAIRPVPKPAPRAKKKAQAPRRGRFYRAAPSSLDAYEALPLAKPAPRAAGRTAKRERHAREVAEIRTAVADRAKGRCEACRRRTLGDGWSLDHWLGGSGRRRILQSVATCWALCRPCDQARSHNRPSAAYWNAVRKVHCERHGLPFVPHIEKGARRGA